MRDVRRHEVGQVAPFCVIPNLFRGIEFGSVGRQPFCLQPGYTLLVQYSNCFAMCAPAIQNHNQRPPQVPS